MPCFLGFCFAAAAAAAAAVFWQLSGLAAWMMSNSKGKEGGKGGGSGGCLINSSLRLVDKH